MIKALSVAGKRHCFRTCKLKYLKVSAYHETHNLTAQLLSKPHTCTHLHMHTHTHRANAKQLRIVEESRWWAQSLYTLNLSLCFKMFLKNVSVYGEGKCQMLLKDSAK